MINTQRILPRLILFASIPIFCVGMTCLFGLVYTTRQLRLASARGVYPSAEAGMHALIERSYRQPDKVQIIYAGTNSFDGSSPHVWYVLACVWGGTRADGSPVGTERHVYDQPGVYFLNTCIETNCPHLPALIRAIRVKNLFSASLPCRL